MPTTRVLWSLGSNIDAQLHLGNAVRQFQQDFADVLVSKVYSSPAVGFVGDPFLNLALAVDTDQSLRDLLRYADAIEQAEGRVRVARGNFDARTLDVDIVLFGELQGEHLGYQWPSEDILQMPHVLRPIADIAAELRHPVSGQRIAALWRDFDKSDVSLTQVSSPW